MQLFQVIQDGFNQPPLKFDPGRQSLKAWAMYCLRDKGFKVVYAEKADFAIETREGNKIYFKVTDDENLVDLTQKWGWLVWDGSSNSMKAIAPPI